MNQILVSEKVYVTPDMKTKKILFKIEFIISVFVLCVLSSYAIYASYDRNKSEQVSQQILTNMNFTSGKQTQLVTQDAIIVTLNKDKKTASNTQQVVEQEAQAPTVQSTMIDGIQYNTIGQINIPSIDVNYPILADWSTDLLKVSACKFWGPNPNEVGNLCIIGHNYLNTKFFSKVPTLQNGDQILITDLSGKTVTYEVYDKYTIDPEDVACTSQKTNGQIEITLITCSDNMKQRDVVKARAIE